MLIFGILSLQSPIILNGLSGVDIIEFKPPNLKASLILLKLQLESLGLVNSGDLPKC